ncbi:MAG: 4Fe-4S binding protein [Anaerolineae bacterium]|nr:4Fe-4S binding protein [Anaerolineae bacterium]
MLGRGMLKGLWVTLQHMISSYTKGPRRFPQRYLRQSELDRPDPDTQGMLTLQYPFERYKMWPRFRGVLVQLRDPETGQPRCTACMACERACPHGVISIVAEGRGRERKPKAYTYELGRCIFCRLCVEACRFDAIEMSQIYEFTSTTKDQTLDLKDLLELGDRSGIRHTGEAWG